MKFKRIGIGLLSGMLMCSLINAEENIRSVGSRAMPLTQQGGTARAMSMGSAVVGVPQGSASLLWNPAGLGRMENCLEAGLHHDSGLGNSNHEIAVVGMPLGPLGGLAASLNFVDNGSFEGRDDVGNKTGSYDAGNVGGSLGWGKEWLPGVSAGLALKYNRQNLAGRSDSAYATDLGLLWNPITRLNLGLTYVNLGGKVSGKNLDSGWRMGAGYNLTKSVLLAASTELKPDGFDRLQAGIEAWINPIVALRGGFVHQFSDQQLSGLTDMTGGIGINITKALLLDYAYVPYGDLGVSQRISLTFKFMCSDKNVPDAS